jgi:hypothetical protein
LTTITLSTENKEILSEKEEEMKKFKYPWVCSEILLCGVQEINGVFSKNNLVMENYFGYLEKRKTIKGEINGCHDTYFIRVFIELIKKNFKEVTTYILEKNENVLKNLVENVDMCDSSRLFSLLFGKNKK